ncbi:MAG: FAD-binding oxidoreductase [Pseudomonadales bacterium]|nr:FAD-binding oxidoreductase [Pseudomonadales bacterium]
MNKANSAGTDRHYDTIIIGAGIAGMSAGALLAADQRVLIIEMETAPGYHATGRSAAYFAPSYGNEVVRRLTRLSEKFIRQPPAGFTDVPLISDRNAMFIGRPDQQAALLAMQVENPHLQWLSPETVLKHLPRLKPEIGLQGLLDTDGGDLDVDALLQGFSRLFHRRGGKLITGQAVASLDRKSQNWEINANYTADRIINAAGAWADNIASLAGLTPLGLQPCRRTALLMSCPEDMTGWPLTIGVDEDFYCKPDAGRLLISPANENPSVAMDAQPEELDVAIAMDRAAGLLDLPLTKPQNQWAGLRTFAPDRTFVVGEDPRASGFFWLAGQGGYGVQSSPAMAALIRYLITGDNSGYDFDEPLINAVRPGRLIP